MPNLTGGKRARILLMSDGDTSAGMDAAARFPPEWQLLEVGDPVETLTAVKSYDIDLVLLKLPVDQTIDMDMPNVLRRVAPSDYLPVVIVTSGAPDNQRCEYLDSGADEVISEQTSPGEAASRIRALLRVKELHDQLSASKAALQEALDRERKLLAKSRRDNAQLQVLCTTDPLTHVQNVRSFQDILQHEWRTARRYGHSLSLLMMDVDHFKVVNDTHGHPSGDYVLKELAVILKQSIRESDVVARTGGEEFSVMLPKADRHHAAKFAERIRGEVYKRNFNVYGQDIHVTISIGSASSPDDAEIVTPEMLVYFADQALLHAKENGRDRVVAVHQLQMNVRNLLRRQYRSVSHTASQATAELDLEARR